MECFDLCDCNDTYRHLHPITKQKKWRFRILCFLEYNLLWMMATLNFWNLSANEILWGELKKENEKFETKARGIRAEFSIFVSVVKHIWVRLEAIKNVKYKTSTIWPTPHNAFLDVNFPKHKLLSIVIKWLTEYNYRCFGCEMHFVLLWTWKSDQSDCIKIAIKGQLLLL